MRAVELAGVIDSEGHLHLEAASGLSAGRVRVLVLWESDEPTEAEWLRAAAAGSAFDFLADVQEDIYSLADGKPFDASR